MSEFIKRVLNVARRWRQRSLIGEGLPEDVQNFDFVDGLIDRSIRVMCIKDARDGRLEWCCQKCGGFGDLFDPDTAVDFPMNSMGVWIRLHKRCA